VAEDFVRFTAWVLSTRVLKGSENDTDGD